MQILVQISPICALESNCDLLPSGGLLSLNVGESAPALLLAKEYPAGDLTAPGDMRNTGGGAVLHQSF